MDPGVREGALNANLQTGRDQRRRPLLRNEFKHQLTITTAAATRPQGEKATDRTSLRWPPNVLSRAPLATSRSLPVQSLDASSTCVASGENTAEYRYRPCPWRLPECPEQGS